MKLNPDCIRDVLLYLEENLNYNHENVGSIEHNSITMSKIAEDLHNQNGYEIDDINYSIEKLLEIRYISSSGESRGRNNSILYCPISDITYSGHQFLNTIRPKPIWEATKNGAAKLGIMSMHALSTIAMEITKAVITNPKVINDIIQHMK